MLALQYITIRVLNLLTRSFLVSSSLAISCIVCVEQAISLLQYNHNCSAITVSYLIVLMDLYFDQLYFGFLITFYFIAIFIRFC